MPQLHLYDKLLQFPVFQGMSHSELMEVVAHVRMGFHKYREGKIIRKAGQHSSEWIFLISGCLQSQRTTDRRECRVVERLSAPFLLEPERLYGAHPSYQRTYQAEGEVHLITIDKEEVNLLMETQLVFRVNVINHLSTLCQRLGNASWRSASDRLDDRLVRYFFSLCQYPAGHKTYYVLMSQLAVVLNSSRLDISKALRALEARGLLSVNRGRIEIPYIEHLLMRN